MKKSEAHSVVPELVSHTAEAFVEIEHLSKRSIANYHVAIAGLITKCDVLVAAEEKRLKAEEAADKKAHGPGYKAPKRDKTTINDVCNSETLN